MSQRELNGARSEVRRLKAELARVKAAVQAHHDQRGDDRCHLDDRKLYHEVLGEGVDPYVGALPPGEDMEESCRRYIRQRRCPGPEGVVPLPGDMTIQQLTDEVSRLTGEIQSLREQLDEANVSLEDDDAALIESHETWQVLRTQLDEARAEVALIRRIVAGPASAVEAEVMALEPGKTAATCLAIDIANRQINAIAKARENRALRSTLGSIHAIATDLCRMAEGTGMLSYGDKFAVERIRDKAAEAIESAPIQVD